MKLNKTGHQYICFKKNSAIIGRISPAINLRNGANIDNINIQIAALLGLNSILSPKISATLRTNGLIEIAIATPCAFNEKETP